MASMAAAAETCAAASDNRPACEKAKICDYSFEKDGKGACGVTPSWAADQLKQCLSTAQNADPVVKDLATTAERCFDRSSSKEKCDEMPGKCTWTAADDASNTPQYCGVAPLHVIMTLLGTEGFAKIVAAEFLCGAPTSQEQCDANPACAWNDDGGGKCGVSVAGALADSIKSTTAKTYLSLISRRGGGGSAELNLFCTLARSLMTFTQLVHGPRSLLYSTRLQSLSLSPHNSYTVRGADSSPHARTLSPQLVHGPRG